MALGATLSGGAAVWVWPWGLHLEGVLHNLEEVDSDGGRLRGCTGAVGDGSAAAELPEALLQVAGAASGRFCEVANAGAEGEVLDVGCDRAAAEFEEQAKFTLAETWGELGHSEQS